MARSAAIPLTIAGLGAVLIISGIQGESLTEVIKGEFGKGTKHPTPNPSGNSENPEGVASVTGEGAGGAGTLGGITGEAGGEGIAPTYLPVSPNSIHVPKKSEAELKNHVSQGLKYKEELEKTPHFSNAEKTIVFNEHYPNFWKEVEELEVWLGKKNA
jgi:hypothetical protein